MAKKKLVHDWMPQDERLKLFYAGIDIFLKDHLPVFDTEISSELKSKIVADPLHGYIQLKSWEVAIIDTKLFQRLRKISQLGLANLVFPSLGYSRFEHSLGVLGTINILLIKLIENCSNEDEKREVEGIIQKYEIPLRIAAILHDIGHCLFSHCSERVINRLSGTENYPSSETIRNIFTNHFEKEGQIPFAEVFAVSLIGNCRFSAFMNSLEIPKRSNNDINDKLEIAANFILGLPHKKEPKSIFLAQLISSGLDADKIDYMAREALYSGIKLEIDLDRIYSKIAIFDIKAHQLPKNLSFLKRQFDSESRFKVLGLKKGGQFTFEEFCVARLALHVKIYLHQKVRAAEAQIGKYLKVLSKETILEKAHEWLTFPESIIEYEDYILNQLNRKNADLFTSVTRHVKEVSFSKLGNREILNRAFGFGFTNNISLTQEGNNEIAKFNELFEKLNEEKIEVEIYEEYAKICKLLKIQTHENIENEIIVDFPRYINIQQGHDSLFFPHPTNLTPKWTIPIDKIMIYYQYNRALAYVFSLKEACPVVYIAAEKIIHNKTGLVFNTETIVSEPIHEKVKDIKSRLAGLRYYDDFPQISPLSKYLKSAEAFEKIQIVLSNLKRFRSQKGDIISINSITTFINQFSEELQPAALEFITYLKVYDEELLANKISETLNSLEDKRNTGISFIGNKTDSGSLFPYHLRGKLDFDDDSILLSELNDSLLQRAERIILFDDNINSGLQLINIFAELLGEKANLPDDYNLTETHVFELISDESKDKLRTIPKYFVFTVGFKGIDSKLKSIFEKYMAIKPETIHVILHEEYTEESKIFSGSNSNFDFANKIKLRKYVEEVGEKLLTGEGKSELKVNNCKLGYANAESMVVFPYNVPTMTITALWCEGEIEGKKWIPIVPRRRRSRKDSLEGEDK